MSISVDDIQFWIKQTQDFLKTTEHNLNTGFYEKEGIPRDVHYWGDSASYLSLAFCHTALGNKTKAIAAFKDSSLLSQRMFDIAYHPESAHYNPNFESWHTVSEQEIIQAISSALCANDYPLATQAAEQWRSRGDDKKAQAPINRFARAYVMILLDKIELAAELLEENLDMYKSKALPKGLNWKKSYYFKSLALYGIVKQDQTFFNEGIRLHTEFYERYAKYGEIKGTNDALMSVDSTAFMKLAVHFGLDNTYKHPLIPELLS